jgi:hypothetical protein
MLVSGNLRVPVMGRAGPTIGLIVALILKLSLMIAGDPILLGFQKCIINNNSSAIRSLLLPSL